eukprot:CAMPEP_0197891280 /NCGR_PEP_ID=MMETSP1439-20131203/27878_1 /TAXON_ID=66791 /ORGANISM="Gonyaulax spinifera, Strain CCMP409" /LENGTH=143 /DNA_ID=CAMNT_0043511367 /DNA_START=247 /DNA_END=676 /DNA_ORIENTATION=-
MNSVEGHQVLGVVSSSHDAMTDTMSLREVTGGRGASIHVDQDNKALARVVGGEEIEFLAADGQALHQGAKKSRTAGIPDLWTSSCRVVRRSLPSCSATSSGKSAAERPTKADELTEGAIAASGWRTGFGACTWQRTPRAQRGV